MMVGSRKQKRAKRNRDDVGKEDIISDRAVLMGVEKEFDRTLPFWRCYTDLKDFYGYSPIVQTRNCTIRSRKPCEVFSGVDVVWAITTVSVRVQTGLSERRNYRLPQKGGTNVTWRGIPYSDVTWVIGTMHFVHHNAHHTSGDGYDRSFHIQSVVNYNYPAVPQCVAGTMISFWLLVLASVNLQSCANECAFLTEEQWQEISEPVASTSSYKISGEASINAGSSRVPFPSVGWLDQSLSVFKQSPAGLCHRGTLERLRELGPHSCSRILVLGMGGNSMAVSLRLILGPHADIHVVEIEPSVVEACVSAGTLLPNDTKQFIHTKSAEKCLPEFLNHYFHFIFMDLFEPLKATMVMDNSLVHLCHTKLSCGGMLVVNDHQLPSVESVSPWVDLFGDGNVSLVNLHGWKESVLVCMKSGDKGKDGQFMECSKYSFNSVYRNLYHQFTPGLLPSPNWIKKGIKLTKLGADRSKAAKVFES